MKTVYRRPRYLKPTPNHYCPGCGHSILHRVVAEVVEEMGIGEIAIGVPPAGCAVLAYFYLDIDMCEAAHGRGAAVATGIKRARPDCLVFTYQGDGDLAAIGTAETIHAANRGERITILYVNNAVYGMTGGQMAPTSLLNMVTTTTFRGRNSRRDGFPLDISKLVAQLPGTAYVERTAVNSPANIRRTKKALATAFQRQMDDMGFSLIEVLSQCPTNWKMSPTNACQWIEEVMQKEFPLGIMCDVAKDK